jgi:hypothetical protein
MSFFYFLTTFFKYFLRVLHEASGSWLKLCWFILGQPVFVIHCCFQNKNLYQNYQKKKYVCLALKRLELTILEFIRSLCSLFPEQKIKQQTTTISYYLSTKKSFSLNYKMNCQMSSPANSSNAVARNQLLENQIDRL